MAQTKFQGDCKTFEMDSNENIFIPKPSEEFIPSVDFDDIDSLLSNIPSSIDFLKPYDDMRSGVSFTNEKEIFDTVMSSTEPLPISYKERNEMVTILRVQHSIPLKNLSDFKLEESKSLNHGLLNILLGYHINNFHSLDSLMHHLSLNESDVEIHLFSWMTTNGIHKYLGKIPSTSSTGYLHSVRGKISFIAIIENCIYLVEFMDEVLYFYNTSYKPVSEALEIAKIISSYMFKYLRKCVSIEVRFHFDSKFKEGIKNYFECGDLVVYTLSEMSQLKSYHIPNLEIGQLRNYHLQKMFTRNHKNTMESRPWDCQTFKIKKPSRDLDKFYKILDSPNYLEIENAMSFVDKMNKAGNLVQSDIQIT